jgi:predicted transcriptional regulator of viral defense system
VQEIQVLLDQDYLVGHVPEAVMEWGLRRVWRDERRVQLADEALTVIDVLDDPSIGGGIRHASEVLEAYVTDFDWRQLIEYGDPLGNRTVFKRLGYLSETLELGDQELPVACRRRLSRGVFLLDPSAPHRGLRVTPWALRANVRIEESGSS